VDQISWREFLALLRGLSSNATAVLATVRRAAGGGPGVADEKTARTPEEADAVLEKMLG